MVHFTFYFVTLAPMTSYGLKTAILTVYFAVIISTQIDNEREETTDYILKLLHYKNSLI